MNLLGRNLPNKSSIGWKRGFYMVFLGQITSMLTSSVVGFSIMLWLSMKTESAKILSFAMIANVAPSIIFGLIASVYIDRWSKRKTLIFSDFLVSICTLAFFFYFLFMEPAPWMVLLLLLPRSIGSSFYHPTLQSTIPLLVPKTNLMQVAGLNQMAISMCNMAGPIIAALLIDRVDLKYILLLDVFGAIIACIPLLCINIPSVKRVAQKSFIQNILCGMQSILDNRSVRYMFFLILSDVFCILPLVALLPLLTIKFFARDASNIGWVQSSWCFGLLLGGLLSGLRRVGGKDKNITMITSSFVIGIFFFISGFLPPSAFDAFVFFTLLSGIGYSLLNSAFLVLLQIQTNSVEIGKTISLTNVFLMLPSLPSLFIIALMDGTIPINHVFIISGLTISAISVLFYMKRQMTINHDMERG